MGEVVVLAHLGGIHEIGLFLVPALLAVAAIRWAERRARRHTAEPDNDATNQATGDGNGRTKSR